MTDFLTRLVQRAIGTGPVVQPLLPSRYAPDANSLLPADPATEGGSVPAWLRPTVEAIGSPQAAAPATEVSGLSTPGSTLPAETLSQASPAPATPPRSEPALDPPFSSIEGCEAPSARRTARSPAPVTAASEAPESSPTARASAPPSPIGADHTSRSVDPRGAGDQSEPRPGIGPWPARLGGGEFEAGRISSTAVVSSRRGPRPDESRPFPVAPDPRPRAAIHSTGEMGGGRPPDPGVARRRAPFDGAPAPPEIVPTIRVTIGRIEVRTVTTPPREPRPAPEAAAPAFSLDDYLKLRRGPAR